MSRAKTKVHFAGREWLAEPDETGDGFIAAHVVEYVNANGSYRDFEVAISVSDGSRIASPYFEIYDPKSIDRLLAQVDKITNTIIAWRAAVYAAEPAMREAANRVEEAATKRDAKEAE